MSMTSPALTSTSAVSPESTPVGGGGDRGEREGDEDEQSSSRFLRAG